MESASPQANRVLAFYLLAVALLQALLYWTVLSRGEQGWALYSLEPRLGLFFLETVLYPNHPFPGYLPGASAVALALVGCLLLLEVVGLRFYMAFEALLALPTVILFGIVAFSGVPPGLGFSTLDLALPAIPFAMTSVVPMIYAWRVLRRLGRDDA